MLRQTEFPIFLRDYGKLLSHLQSQFDGLTSVEKGNHFAKFAKRVIPLSEVGERFETPMLRQPTHDEGIDLECESKDKTEVLYVQAKYTIPSVDEFDTIVSKFQDYEETRSETDDGQMAMFDDDEESEPMSRYMVITSSDLERIEAKYARSSRPSKLFYNQLELEDRLHILDGPKILPLLQIAYRKLHVLPSNLELSLDRPFVQMGKVYIGITSAYELKRLYDEFGDALFLENIREFLGPSSGRVKSGGKRTTVNEAIIETIQTQPSQFLARNNGIVIRAGSVKVLDKENLQLDNASIVNGCQTTMALVQNPDGHSYVLIKVVQAEDSWDIAKAANFQNRIDQIDLDLARYIRPQAIRAAATKFDVKFESSGEASAFAVLSAIYRARVTYNEVRSLYIGLFSRTPNNAFTANYTELRTDIIEKFYEEDPDGEKTFDTLFKIHQVAQQGNQEIQEVFQSPTYADLFQRFWKDDKPNYRSFLAILAACGCAGKNIYAKDEELSYEDMVEFLEKVRYSLAEQPDVFVRYYRHAFKAVAVEVIKQDLDRSEMLQTMYTSMRSARFDNLYKLLCVFVDDDSDLQSG
jgi:hypothetical protein